jgi:hypothetical protein
MTDIHQEYEEGFDTLGDAGTIFYKFISGFIVRIRGPEVDVRYGMNIQDADLPLAVAEKFRAYIKEQKEWIREQGKEVDVKEARRRMWWTVSKMLDMGIFAAEEQHVVIAWLNTCLTQL